MPGIHSLLSSSVHVSLSDNIFYASRGNITSRYNKMTAALLDTSSEAITREEKRKSRKHSKRTKEVDASDVGASLPDDARKTKKERRKEVEVVDVGEIEEQAETEGSKPKKKRHHKTDPTLNVTHPAVSQPALEGIQDPESAEEKKKKRKDKGKERGVPDAVGGQPSEAGEDPEKSKEKRKRKEKVETGDQVMKEAEDATGQGKETKRKRKRDRDADAEAGSDTPKDTVKEKKHKKKRRKHSTHGFSDPDEDEDISDQSKKGTLRSLIVKPNRFTIPTSSCLRIPLRGRSVQLEVQ